MITTAGKKIFIDTTILTAFIDRGNINHLRSAKAIEILASMGYRVYTSSQVISDAYDQLLVDVGTTVALEFLQTMLETGIEILFPQKADVITAHRILKVNRNQDITLREALSAALMQKRGITQILTFTHWNNLFGTHSSSITANP